MTQACTYDEVVPIPVLMTVLIMVPITVPNESSESFQDVFNPMPHKEVPMLLITLESIPGKAFEILDMVKGSTIQSKNIGKDILSGLKTLVGGELTQYVEMVDEARALATKRMVMQAEKLGADAILGIRYATTSVMQGAAEVMVYGTAVKFKQTSSG